MRKAKWLDAWPGNETRALIRCGRGHPFVYQVSPPVAAAGLRISADLLLPDAEGEGSFVHAWAEVFAFEGERNIARGGRGPQPRRRGTTGTLALESRISGRWPDAAGIAGDSRGRAWQYRLDLRRPGQSERGGIGDGGPWRASVVVDAVRLLPAKRPTSDLPSGFGFPRKLAISISATGEPGDRSKWSIVAEREMRNPGHNPVVVPFDADPRALC